MGWLSDYFSLLAVLRLCGVATLAGALLLPLMAGSPVANFALLFLWGGFAGALYPVALSMAGDRFRGSQLLAANAAVVMCYGFGSLAGPALGGAAMSLVDPHGLMLCVALAVAVFLPATFLGARAVEPEGPRASPLR
jgi:MFS family permease